MKARFLCVILVLLVLPLGLLTYPILSNRDTSSPIATSLGDVDALEAAFADWAAAYEAAGGKEYLRLAMGFSKALSARFTEAEGEAEFDIASGAVSITVTGLPEAVALEVWLIDNQPGPGRSVRPEPGDRMLSLGHLDRQGDDWRLEANLGDLVDRDFRIDLVAVGPQGTSPDEVGLLFGAPSLFQKLYYQRRVPGFVPVAETGRPEDVAETALSGFGFLVPRPAFAQNAGGPKMQAMIERGQDLFLNETFDGNGRTCATCHPPTNNFTIGPLFIATLPADDPLFVAEFDPALAQDFENPALMREFGLIVENTNGFGDLANNFTMRGTPHTLALPTSIDGPDGDPRLGWGGDGSPGDGSLRMFAAGAVTQHFPKTLGRVPGVDFVLPSEAELDDMEAFQLSLGREGELSLPLKLLGTVASHGQEVFLSDESRCSACHLNAGANDQRNGENRNFDTGVEDMDDAPALLTDEMVPADDGFGNPGDRTFNTPTLVEAADTGPFFHNNSVETIEGAVAFYNSDAFNNSPAGARGIIDLTTPEVVAVAGFLRVLNALENIRSAISVEKRASKMKDNGDILAQLRFALAETEDAIFVLAGGGLHPEAVVLLRQAAATLRSLGLDEDFDDHDLNDVIGEAIELQSEARADMIKN